MNRKMQNAVAAVHGAYVASLKCQAALKALGAGAAHSTKFRLQAARVVAEDANTFYHLTGDKRMVAYEGQRDIAFGVPEYEKNDKGEIIIKRYERTVQCNATRMWFARNVMGKKAAKGKERGGVWKQIGNDIAEINALRRKLDPAGRAAFHKALAALVEKFAEKVE